MPCEAAGDRTPGRSAVFVEEGHNRRDAVVDLRRHVRHNRDAIELHGSVGWDEDPEKVADTAEEQAPDFHWLKLYAGTGTLREDLDRIEVVRQRVGDDHPFLLDVNGLWSPLEALTAGPVLRELGVRVVEQPVCSRDDAGQARVAAAYAEQHLIAVV